MRLWIHRELPGWPYSLPLNSSPGSGFYPLWATQFLSPYFSFFYFSFLYTIPFIYNNFYKNFYTIFIFYFSHLHWVPNLLFPFFFFHFPYLHIHVPYKFYLFFTLCVLCPFSTVPDQAPFFLEIHFTIFTKVFFQSPSQPFCIPFARRAVFN